MRFQRERIHDVIEEALPLLRNHFEEIAHFKDIPLEPDFELYMKMEDADSLRVFTVRMEDNKLIGYASFFVRHNPHYKSSFQAVQDVVFIEKEHRGFGKSFLDWCDSELKKDGVEITYHHVKSKHNFGPMLETLGYELVDLIYARRLT